MFHCHRHLINLVKFPCDYQFVASDRSSLCYIQSATSGLSPKFCHFHSAAHYSVTTVTLDHCSSNCGSNWGNSANQLYILEHTHVPRRPCLNIHHHEQHLFCLLDTTRPLGIVEVGQPNFLPGLHSRYVGSFTTRSFISGCTILWEHGCVNCDYRKGWSRIALEKRK